MNEALLPGWTVLLDSVGHRFADETAPYGILDNAAALRSRLTDAGVELASDTDTEVLAHLIAAAKGATLEEKVAQALSQVEGTWGLAVLHADFPDRIVLARNGSPLIIGVGNREMHVASDLAALVRHTTTVAHLADGELATVTSGGFTTFTSDLRRTDREAQDLDLDPSAFDAGDHESFMAKEIADQPEAAVRVLRGRLDERFATAHLGGLGLEPADVRRVARVKILGCGSAYYVGQMGASLVEELARHGYKLSPGTLYPLLQRMERLGWLKSKTSPRRGRPRKDYRLTTQGRRVLVVLREQITELYDEVVRGVEEKGHR